MSRYIYIYDEEVVVVHRGGGSYDNRDPFSVVCWYRGNG